MSDCIITGEYDCFDTPYGTYGEQLSPVVEEPCCKEFAEDFANDTDQYNLDIDNDGNVILTCTSEDPEGDKQITRVDSVYVCPYCGAKIKIVGLEKYHPDDYTDESEWVV